MNKPVPVMGSPVGQKRVRLSASLAIQRMIARSWRSKRAKQAEVNVPSNSKNKGSFAIGARGAAVSRRIAKEAQTKKIVMIKGALNRLRKDKRKFKTKNELHRACEVVLNGEIKAPIVDKYMRVHKISTKGLL